jgi:hypothetical protein
VSTITLEELNTFARKIVKFHQQLTNPDINRSCQIFDAANPERKECQLLRMSIKQKVPGDIMNKQINSSVPRKTYNKMANLTILKWSKHVNLRIKI